MLKHKATHALPEVTCSRAHRFDFSVLGIQFLQSATAHQLSVFPDAPEGNVRFAQSIEVQRVPAFWRGNLSHAPKMFGQQFADLATAKIVAPDFQGLLHLREGVSDAITTA
jgi:hypothetical protein